MKNKPLILTGMILVGALLLLFGALFSGQYTLFYRDLFHNYPPHLSYMKEVLLQGELPLWHAGVNGGTPFVPGLEPPLFYPGTWLFFVFSFPVALGLNLILHHLLAGLGMYWLCRHLKWHYLSALVATLAFSLGSMMLSMNNVYPLMNTMAWIPWIFGLAHVLLHTPTARISAAFGAVYGLQILSGHLEIVFFESLVLLGYACYTLIRAQKTQPAPWRQYLLWGLLALLSGLLLSAIQFLPSLSYVSISGRNTGISLEMAQTFSWHPVLLLLFILPDMQGNAYQMASLHTIFGDPVFNFGALFHSIYQSIPAILLALFAILNIKHHPHKHFAVFCILAFTLCTLIALGAYTPVYGWVYEWLPGTSFFRYPSKWLIFSSFFLALLSGLGLESLLQQHRATRKEWAALLISSGLLLVVFGGFFVLNSGSYLSFLLQTYRPDDGEFIHNYLAQLVSTALNAQIQQGLLLLMLSTLCLAWGLKQKQAKVLGLFSVLILADLLSSGINTLWLSERHLFEDQPAAMQDLQEIRQHDGSLASLERMLVTPIDEKPIPQQFMPELLGILTLHQYAYSYQTLFLDLPLRWQEHVPFTGWPARTKSMEMLGNLHHQALKEGQASARHRIETALAIRYILLANPDDEELAYMQNSGHYRLRKELPEINSSIWENIRWQPRVRFMTQAALVADQDLALKSLIFPESGLDPVEHLILEKTPELESQVQAIPPQIPAQPAWTLPQITHESNQRLEIAFETNQSGYVVLADQWTPGWRAWRNGEEVPILRANGFQRAIRVGPGQNQIRFEYTLPGFRAGVVLTGLGLLLLLALWFWPRPAQNSEDLMQESPVAS